MDWGPSEPVSKEFLYEESCESSAEKGCLGGNWSAMVSSLFDVGEKRLSDCYGIAFIAL